MKKTSKKFLFISLILGLSALFSTAQVIGIDWGNEFYKISLIAPGKSFVIIENTTSKRKTNNAITFVDNHRVFESDTVVKRVKNPKNTLVNLQKFLGVPFLSANDQITLARKYFEEADVQEVPGRGAVGFQIKGFQLSGDDSASLIVSIEEAVAMILRQAKTLSEKQAGMPIKDCVFTISPDFSIRKRRALSDAASLAGLNIMEMINENTAAALYHGLERQDLNQTHTVIFYNMGSSTTKVSVVEYIAVNLTNMKRPTETFKVLAHQVEHDLGGWSFDLALATHFAQEFDKYPQRKGKESAVNIKPIMLKLMKEVVKCKEVLSANKEAQFYVEGIYDDIDFKSTITRTLFEEKAAHLFERVLNPVHDALKKANKTIEEIDIIEILGGAVRIPKIQQILSTFHGKELGQHLNGDEAMAYGAAFYAANFSRNFKVRQVWMTDGFEHDISAAVKAGGRLGEEFKLFNQSESYGKLFDLNLIHESDDVIINFYNAQTKELLKSTTLLNLSTVSEAFKNKTFLNESTKYIQTRAVAPRNDTENIHLYIKLKLSSVEGVFVDTTFAEIVQESVRETFEEVLDEEEQEESNDVKSSNDTETNGTTSEQSPENSTETTEQNETNSDLNNSTDSNSSNETNETQAPSQQKKPKFKLVPKLTTEYVIYHYPLEISEDYGSPEILSPENIMESMDKIQKFDDYEYQMRRTAESKNRLEAFVYEIRELNSDEHYVKVSTEEQRENLTRLAQENDDWLYSDEASEANYTVFDERYQLMNDTINPILFRRHELKNRDYALNSTKDILQVYNNSLTNVSIVPPWVTPVQKAPTYELIKNTTRWVEEMEGLQRKTPLTENPVFTLYQLSRKIQDVYDNITRLRMIPKPEFKKDLFKDKAFFEEFMANLTKNGTFNKTNNKTTPEDGPASNETNTESKSESGNEGTETPSDSTEPPKPEGASNELPEGASEQLNEGERLNSTEEEKVDL